MPVSATLRGHRAPVRALGFSSNGQYLVSGDDEGFCIFWKLRTRRPLAVWSAHENAMLTTEFWDLNRESYIVTHARDNKLRIWRNPLNCEIDFSTDPLGTELDSGGQSTRPRPWLVYTQDVNALNFCTLALYNRSFATPATVASERIDVYHLDENFQVSRKFKELDAGTDLDLSTEKRGNLGVVMSLWFAAENVLVAGYESGHIVVFENGKVKWLVQPFKGPVLCLMGVGGEVYATSAERSVVKVDLDTGLVSSLVTLEHRGVASISVCKPHNLAVTAGWDGVVRLFDLALFQEIESFSAQVEGITVAKVSLATEDPKTRQLGSAPLGWVAIAGKNGRISLHAVLKQNKINKHYLSS